MALTFPDYIVDNVSSYIGADLLGGARYPAPASGDGYAYFDNSGGLIPNQPLGNLLLTFTDINGLERPLTMTGGA